MNTDIRISLDLFSNIKIKRLMRAVGHEGLTSLLRLWIYTAQRRSDGVLVGMTADDVEIAADWDGEHGALVTMLTLTRLLDHDGETYSIHDWEANNPWAAGAARRSEKARANANKRHGHQHASSMLVAESQHASGNAPSPSPSPSPSPNHVHVGSTAAAADVCVFDDPAPEDQDPAEDEAALEAKSVALVKGPAGCGLAPAPKSDDTYSPEFKVFWEPYPRKVVKDAAAESYKRARSKGATAEEIQAGLARWLGSVDWADQDIKHLPHASTWLNQRRWKDEPEQATKAVVIPMAANGKPDDLAWERSFVKAYDTDAERIEALVDRARAVQRVVLDKTEAQDVLDACGLEGAMRWVRDAVQAGVRGRAGVTHG